MVALVLEFVHLHRVAVKRKFTFVLGPLQQPRYHHAGGVKIVGDDLVGAMQGQTSLNLHLVGNVKMKGPSAFKMVCTGDNTQTTRETLVKKNESLFRDSFGAQGGTRTHTP